MIRHQEFQDKLGMQVNNGEETKKVDKIAARQTKEGHKRKVRSFLHSDFDLDSRCNECALNDKLPPAPIGVIISTVPLCRLYGVSSLNQIA